MKVLVAGAGAIGMVYAAHLKRSGAHVALFVRPPRAEELVRGTTLYRMRAMRRPVVETFVPDQIVTSVEEVASEGWDQIFLCVPTSALNSPTIEALLGAVGEATVVAIQPGIDVRNQLSALVPERQLVSGVVGLIAYQGPLPGETLDPGVVFLFPPLTRSAFSGHPDRVDSVVAALRRGGCPAEVVPDARLANAFASASMMPLVVALEGAGWSFDELRHGPWLSLASRASREAVALTERLLSTTAPPFRVLVRPTLLRLALTLLPPLLPFDLEKYMRFHFTKVGDQSRQLVRGYTDAALREGVDVKALSTLEERVFG